MLSVFLSCQNAAINTKTFFVKSTVERSAAPTVRDNICMYRHFFVAWCDGATCSHREHVEFFLSMPGDLPSGPWPENYACALCVSCSSVLARKCHQAPSSGSLLDLIVK